MKIAPFLTEHFFARYEFSTPYQLCNSDCETLTVAQLLTMAEIPAEDFGRLSLGYTDSAGSLALRQGVAADLAGVTPEDILVLGTPVEGIYLAARALLEPGDEVIVLSPAYDALINLFEHVAGKSKVRRWEFHPADGRWELDLEDLKHLISRRTRLVVVNFPHNPTGFLPTRAFLDELIRVIEAHNLILFCDEMYFGLVHPGTEVIPSAAELSPRAIVLSGLSKTYGLPGLRTGWLVIRDAELRGTVFNWKFYTSICPPAPSEFLAQAAWKVRQQLRERSLALIAANLHLADGFFERWRACFTWRKPMAGSVALVGMDVPSVSAYATEMAEKAGVLILPAVCLGWDDQHLRMGFGRASFGEALQKFDAYLKA